MLGELAPFVPLLQTLAWILFIAILGIALRKHIGPSLTALRKRIERGSAVKAGPFEVGEDLRQLELVQPRPEAPLPPSGPVDWAAERQSVYDDARHLFLAHVIEPSEDQGQEFDVFVYLVGHKDHDLSEVKFAEFFFGHYWGNEVFTEVPTNGRCGVRTSAYGPFLCTARVHFRDGYVSFLSRYIDFEMGRLWHTT